MSKTIELTRGKVAIVDDEDYEELNKVSWFYGAGKDNCCYSGRRSRKIGMIYMHRVIIEAKKGESVDHINGNTLDNRKENLRICTAGQNKQNSGKPKNNTSGFKGVFWHKRSKKWEVKIGVDNKSIWGGLFVDKIKGAKKYNEMAIKYHGEFALLNKI